MLVSLSVLDNSCLLKSGAIFCRKKDNLNFELVTLKFLVDWKSLLEIS